MEITITAVVICGNAQDSIKKCIESLTWCQEIILVAANSTDNSVKIAKSTSKKVSVRKTTDQYGKNFAKWRNIGLGDTKTDWLLYIDTDEVVSTKLKNDILQTIQNPANYYYAIPRANHFLGQRVHYGGTYPDYVLRLFKTKKLKKWTGKLHEKPAIIGEPGYLKSDLLHYTHTDLTSMLEKTIIWTQLEAQALYNVNHPPVVWWRFFRMMLSKLAERLISQQMYKDGTVGFISAIFESFNTFIIYARLWELQQK